MKLNHTREPYLLLTDKLIVQDFSPGLLEAMGLAAEDLSGHQLLEFFTPRDHAAAPSERLAESLLQGIELECRRPDGGELVLRADALPLSGALRGYLVHLQDRTREARAKEELFHLARLTTVGRLFSGMVHEINNTLSGIVGYAQLLLLDQHEPEVQSDLRKILDEALRTSQLVENILSFLRLRAMKRSEISLASVLDKAIRLRSHALKTANIHLKVRLPATLPSLAGDEILLRQVFVNVITNAEKSILSMRRGGVIRVHAAVSGTRVRVAIADDGPGIPAGLEEKIFTPFFSTRAEGDGCGLGLSICRDILELHDATITARRRRVGGACFVVTFNVPAIRLRASPPAQPDAAIVPQTRRLHVVVIDDEDTSRDVVARAFHGPGNEVIPFGDSETALRYITTHAVDLIISDIHRPGLNGISFYQRLKVRAPRLGARVIFITGDMISDEVASFLRATAPNRYLRKPVQIAQLLEAARIAMEAEPARIAAAN
ncbi:MAG: ATP-binding protein [Planctomycetota bacterium]